MLAFLVSLVPVQGRPVLGTRGAHSRHSFALHPTRGAAFAAPPGRRARTGRLAWRLRAAAAAASYGDAYPSADGNAGGSSDPSSSSSGSESESSSGYASDQDYPSDSYSRSPVDAVRSAVFDQGRISELKMKLLQIAAITSRGQLATRQQKASVEEMVSELESKSPTAAPLESPDFDGIWQLVYCSKPLYATNPFLLPAATPLSSIGRILQTINLDLGELVNEVEMAAFPAIRGAVVSTARIVPINANRLEVNVEKVTLRGKDIADRIDLGGIKFDVPVERIYARVQRGPSPETYLETYFLESDMRISRSRDGTIFVFIKGVM